MLLPGLSPSEVAITLCYYDYAHFLIPLKITGVTPKAFQLHPQKLYPNFLPSAGPEAEHDQQSNYFNETTKDGHINKLTRLLYCPGSL